MRGFAIFIFAMLSVGAAMLLFGAWYSWAMADFDCADGYLECRETWFRSDGPWVAGIIVAWTAAAIWLCRTREKH